MPTSLYADAFNKIHGKLHLEIDEAEALLHSIVNQELTEAQIAGLLVGLASKGESVSEVVGFARGMRKHGVRLNHKKANLMDTAGTGGDASGTFNISTCAAFVIAGAGIPVAKHGNRAMSSRCGSADVLHQLGVNLAAPVLAMERCLEDCGIAFLFAPIFHPAMKAVAKVRGELRIRTIFNLLGPLLNPAGARRQIVGVFAPRLTEMLAEVLLQLGCESAMIVSSEDGLDEISTGAPTMVTEIHRGTCRSYSMTPEDVGLAPQPKIALVGGDIECNARIVRQILEGQERGAQLDAVLLNAAAGIYVAGHAESLSEGLSLAHHSIESGQALQKLDDLVVHSNLQVAVHRP